MHAKRSADHGDASMRRRVATRHARGWRRTSRGGLYAVLVALSVLQGSSHPCEAVQSARSGAGGDRPLSGGVGSPPPAAVRLSSTPPGPGRRTFTSQQAFGTGDGPRAVAAADLNDDGIVDLVVANRNSEDVSVLLGHGDGTFAAQQRVQALWPSSAAVADLNVDGIPDLVIGNSENSYITLFIGRGDGTTFTLSRVVGGRFPVSVAVTDFNGDGVPDLAAADFTGDVEVRLGVGNGWFTESAVQLRGQPTAVVVADLNGDGAIDIVTANLQSNDVAVVLGRGDGTFAEARFFWVQRLDGQRAHGGLAPSALAVADVSGDRVPDVVTANAGSDDVSVLLGRGDGTFGGAAVFAAGRGPTAVAVADLTGDGVPDVVTANLASDDVTVLSGRGDGTFAAPASFAAGDAPSGVAVADLNGDGLPDIVVANSLSNDVSVLLAQSAPLCVGDCDGNGQVTVDEVMRGVTIALGSTSPADCSGLDRNTDGQISVDELVAAVHSALGGCAPAAHSAPTATPPSLRTGGRLRTAN